MSDHALTTQLDELMHELDMLVFRLERSPSEDLDALLAERRRTRRELERLRDQVGEVLRRL
jgi:hypothetical protein